MCHGTQDWVDVLPVVLLGLRTSFKKDLRATAAELVYGTTLRLPGEFFLSDEPANDPQIFLKPFRERIRRVRSEPAAHHSKARAFAHRTLHSCTHVFVRVGGSSGPLCQPYKGPFEVLERVSDSVLCVNVNGKPSTISTERLKPAFFEATQQTDIAPTMEGNNDSQSPISNQPKTYLSRKRICFTTSFPPRCCYSSHPIPTAPNCMTASNCSQGYESQEPPRQAHLQQPVCRLDLQIVRALSLMSTV
ncbi:uncharacterized protein LOC122521628 [Polistes fuscatus]|uniref:uncharacterized protein LOC122521628 n=1 Tax=Polistes fuscatus TaxID=30207 RepID=UPI001CA91A61|nr:uncharacterized protein LOC122521628 [Polistes fuscatus]